MMEEYDFDKSLMSLTWFLKRTMNYFLQKGGNASISMEMENYVILVLLRKT